MAGVVDEDEPPRCSEAKTKYKTIFGRFRSEFGDQAKLKQAFYSICNSIDNPLVALEITSCNGAAGYGVDFSSASCETLPFEEEVFPFGSIFKHGVVLLKQFFASDDYIPEDDFSAELLSTLLIYLSDASSHEVLNSLINPDFAETETEVEIVLTRHLLAKLSSTSNYTFSHRRKIPEQCACGSCKENMRRKFGDTSIGNGKCWHGSLDIIFDGIDMFVNLTRVEENKEDCSVDRVSAEVGDLRSRSRILAELITYSFLQRKLHHEMRPHSLIPCVAISREEVKFFFYDSDKDILMETREHRIMFREKLNLEAVIALWLVVNYKHTCSGPTAAIVKAPTAKFFHHAEKYIDVYRNSMKFKSVNKHADFKLIDYRYLAKSKPKFVWPSEQEPLH